MPRAVPFYYVDVFASEPLTGNPLSVVDCDDGFPEDLMRRIAREFNQSETTFILPPTLPDADWQLRSFTPKGLEVFGAGGHNTLGAWWWLAASGRLVLQDGETQFLQQIGTSIYPLTVHKSGGTIETVTMAQTSPVWSRMPGDRGALAEALGLDISVISDELPCQVVSSGASHLLVPLINRRHVDHAIPDANLLLNVLRSVDGEGCYVFSLDAPGTVTSAYARFFNPTVGIAEDPATGTAAGPLAAHIVRHGIAKPGIVAIEQGTALGRQSIIEASVGDDIVSIAARCVIAGGGMLNVL